MRVSGSFFVTLSFDRRLFLNSTHPDGPVAIPADPYAGKEDYRHVGHHQR
ncbi:hypothetical protein NBRC3257_1608 [Gluconobacter thailandicus NBRC 3257]|uniref:Uncharacterized protein n=1 Tax=Gluconobacter thailandicus NBRC 3257 TaxID=1381097 RepID=A0ABQ0IWN7_GLUTH|nr:hypothetical protein NBRC3255_1600 [Gluconobacter thailandicus NBRC 3255]GAD26609.1 hypothetical protein NBRC3257_1608 [Gluconobacter thailandicus NBRC 3257]